MVPGNWQFIPESSDNEKVSPPACGLSVKDCWEVFLSGQGVFSRVQLILELLQSYVCWGGGHLGYGAFCQRTSHRRTGISFNSQQNCALANGNSPMLKRMHTYARTVKKIYALPKCTQCVTDSDAQWPAAATTNFWMIVSTPCVPVPCVS